MRRSSGWSGSARAAIILAVGMWLAASPWGRAAAAPVQLAAKEFLYEPKEATSQAGEVVFVIKNEGAIEHNFVLQDATQKKIAEVAVIEPGTTAQVKAVLTPGTYRIVCTLPGHREAGMIATLRIPK
jgi:uncharacterized cupredoxin-like copper-binding protein